MEEPKSCTECIYLSALPDHKTRKHFCGARGHSYEVSEQIPRWCPFGFRPPSVWCVEHFREGDIIVGKQDGRAGYYYQTGRIVHLDPDDSHGLYDGLYVSDSKKVIPLQEFIDDFRIIAHLGNVSNINFR